jgi:hypothetical protein
MSSSSSKKDGEGDDGEKLNTQTKGVNQPMRDAIRKALMLYVTKSADPDNVIAKLKNDKSLKLQDDEIPAVKSAIEIVQSLLPEEQMQKKEEPKADPEPKAKADDSNAEVLKLLKDMGTRIDAVQGELIEQKKENQNLLKERSVDSLERWIENEAPFYPGNNRETAEKVFQLEQLDKDAAQILKDGIKQASVSNSRASDFVERGLSGEELEGANVLGSDYVRKFNARLAEISKSGGDATKPADILRDVLKSAGENAYHSYREELRRRSPTTQQVQ